MEKQIDDIVDSLDRRIRLVMSCFRQCKEDPKSLQKVLCRLGAKESLMISKVIDKIDMPIGKAKVTNELDTLLESESQLDQLAEEHEDHADSSPITPGLGEPSLAKKDDSQVSPITPGLEVDSLEKK